ncbi:hypothetical protein [Bacteroides sp. UBA939]|uniref:hypothetical protein n=1 Tax=Bacteroides sp. UBA939 TaxID=1946092 RepID=UPI0025C36CF8|nr:hypothetical protein [Bacteroides sp. UBA939]
MKNLVTIFACVLLLSCNTKKMTLSPYVAVYKSEGGGIFLPTYIFLRTQPKVYEIYAPGIRLSTIGQWNISNDTLFFLAKYEYSGKNNELYMYIPEEPTISSIPQQYLIRNDSLIDITDYSTILLYKSSYKEVYVRYK